MILGVCKGLAEYFDVKVKWVRIAAVIALIATGFWPALALSAAITVVSFGLFALAVRPFGIKLL